ncbi:hypothetical protein QTP88_017097 [Uroleucon formosanum]
MYIAGSSLSTGRVLIGLQGIVVNRLRRPEGPDSLSSVVTVYIRPDDKVAAVPSITSQSCICTAAAETAPVAGLLQYYAPQRRSYAHTTNEADVDIITPFAARRFTCTLINIYLIVPATGVTAAGRRGCAAVAAQRHPELCTACIYPESGGVRTSRDGGFYNNLESVCICVKGGGEAQCKGERTSRPSPAGEGGMGKVRRKKQREREKK